MVNISLFFFRKMKNRAQCMKKIDKSLNRRYLFQEKSLYNFILHSSAYPRYISLSRIGQLCFGSRHLKPKMTAAKLTISELVAAANSMLKSSMRNKVVVPATATTDKARFELYHCGLSLCSQKVRFTLAELGVPYNSHDLDLVSRMENYYPEYIRLRLAAVEADVTLASGFTGSSSVATNGFDAAVVPTLVDHEAQKVVVDSATIVKYLAKVNRTKVDLYPEHLAKQIEEHVRVVDDAPHAALLYGANPEGDTRPWVLRRKTKDIHSQKIQVLKERMATVKDDDLLISAYEAKISKEEAAHAFVSQRESMAEINARLLKGVRHLETQLSAHGKEWACGEQFTVADIMWGVSLFRMKWIGVGHLFSKDSTCPLVHDYSERLFARNTFQSAIPNWPLAYMPSPHLPQLNTFSHYLRSASNYITIIIFGF